MYLYDRFRDLQLSEPKANKDLGKQIDNCEYYIKVAEEIGQHLIDVKHTDTPNIQKIRVLENALKATGDLLANAALDEAGFYTYKK